VPDGPDELAELERRRAELYTELGRVGDFRRGSLNEVRRKCGKPNCACAAPGHPGHGPQWNLTRTVDGRTRAVHLRPGPELEKARREVAEHAVAAGAVPEPVALPAHGARRRGSLANRRHGSRCDGCRDAAKTSRPVA
jgi:hypothetical protein